MYDISKGLRYYVADWVGYAINNSRSFEDTIFDLIWNKEWNNIWYFGAYFCLLIHNLGVFQFAFTTSPPRIFPLCLPLLRCNCNPTPANLNITCFADIFTGEVSTASISFKSLPYLLPDSNVRWDIQSNQSLLQIPDSNSFIIIKL